jgi:hypothetical protein
VIALLILKAIAAVASLFTGMRRAALFLGVSLASDLIRPALQTMRAGYPKPYTGEGFALWLPDVAIFLALPAVLLASVTRWTMGVALWLLAFGFVAVSYPGLRGDSLITFYAAYYLTVYVVVSVLVVARSATRKITPEEALLLLFALSGIAGVLLVVKFGAENWIAVRIPNGAAYAASLGVALSACVRRPASPPRT